MEKVIEVYPIPELPDELIEAAWDAAIVEIPESNKPWIPGKIIDEG